MGLLMALLATGVLLVDHQLVSWFHVPVYPCLMGTVVLLVVLCTLELHALLDGHPRPPLWLCLAGTLSVTLASVPALVGWRGADASPWRDVAWVVTAVLLFGFLWEMATYRQPGGVVVRLGLLMWLVGYLGLLPAFFVQLRWWPAESPSLAGVAALALVIFVPKGGDIGAYFTGRALGRHPMTPLLSPKKTWEGLAGGLILSIVVAIVINRTVAPVLHGDGAAAAFGLVVGVVGVLGDLAESLIKRDCQKKDASKVVPGFGGVLDVVDSVLFAAPVAYWWLR
jgi:phosphatidate cytidylyltransferase